MPKARFRLKKIPKPCIDFQISPVQSNKQRIGRLKTEINEDPGYP
jgi:hypothetical protein